MKKLKKFGFIIALCIAICLIVSLNNKTYATTFEKGAINLNEENKCTLTNWDDKIEYTFTPTKSGVYTFYSRGGEDVYSRLYLDDNSIAYDDDSGKDFNFCMVKDLEANKTYKFEVSIHSREGDGNFSVFVKEETIASIEYTPFNEYILYENSNGSWKNSSNEKYFNYNYNKYSDGDILTLHYKDGSSRAFTYIKDKSPSGFYDKNNEYIKTFSIRFIENQYEDHWEKDKQNHLVVRYLNYFETEIPVTVVENFVSSIELNPVKPYQYYEKTNGDYNSISNYDEDGKYLGTIKAWHYDWDFNVGDTLTVHYTDGTQKVYTYYYNDYWDRGFVDTDNKKLENVFRDDNQDSTPWTIGGNNSVTITYSGRTVDFNVAILENPIKKLTFTPAKPVEYKENTNGYWREIKKDKFFYYYVPSFNKGDKLTVQLKDGSTDIYTFHNGSKYGFYDEDGNKAQYEIDYTSNQETDHWIYGGENNYYIVTFMGNEAIVPVTILEYPILSINFQTANNYYFIENLNGLTEPISIYDENGNFVRTDYYFSYYLREYSKFSKGDTLTVNYKDSNKGTVVYTYDGSQFKSESGEKIYSSDVKFTSNQKEHHWAYGEENYLQVNYMDSTVDIPVSIIKNNVASIQFIPKNDIELIENLGGDTDTYEEYDEDSKTYIKKEYYKYYTYFLHNKEGNKIIINYTDETSETYTYTYNAESNDHGFYTDDGKVLDSRYFSSSDNQSKNNRWTIDNDNKFITLKYAGKSTQVPVTIKEHPIKSIEYIPIKSSFEENTNGYWNNNYYNYNVFREEGDKIILHYKNSETSEYTLGTYEINGKSSYVYYNSPDSYIDRLDIYWSDNQYTTHWTLGNNNYITITYMGISTQVPITITENSVKSIEYTPIKPFVLNEYTGGEWGKTTIWNSDIDDSEDIEYYYYYTSGPKQGDILTVHYQNGDTTKYTYGYYPNFDHYDGYKSENDDFIAYADTDFSTGQSYDSQWLCGKDNYITFSYHGSSAKIPVTIVGDEVASISYETKKNYEYNENTNGSIQKVRYFDEKTQKRVTVDRFIYDYGFCEGDILKVKTKNGDTISYTYKEANGDEKRGFYNDKKRLVADKDITCSANQFDATAWEAGEHYFTVKYKGKETKVKVTIIGEKQVTECKHENTEKTASTKVTKKASLTEDGIITTLTSTKCKDCNEIVSEEKSTTKPIYHPTLLTLKTTSYNYDGKEKKPEVVITDSNKKVIDAKNYSVTFTNNKNVGKAKVTITFKGDSYQGTMTGEFKIKAKSISKATVSGLKDKTYTGKELTQALTIKDGKTKLKLNVDYTVKYSSNKNVGTAKVTITGKGNYTGSLKFTFVINPQATKITKKTSDKKSFKVTWKKVAKEASGYQIQYTTDKKFKKNIVSVSVNKNSTTSKNISGLSKNKKYFVKIRTYKKVGNKTYYSSWSTITNVTTKK